MSTVSGVSPARGTPPPVTYRRRRPRSRHHPYGVAAYAVRGRLREGSAAPPEPVPTRLGPPTPNARPAGLRVVAAAIAVPGRHRHRSRADDLDGVLHTGAHDVGGTEVVGPGGARSATSVAMTVRRRAIAGAGAAASRPRCGRSRPPAPESDASGVDRRAGICHHPAGRRTVPGPGSGSRPDPNPGRRRVPGRRARPYFRATAAPTVVAPVGRDSRIGKAVAAGDPGVRPRAVMPARMSQTEPHPLHRVHDFGPPRACASQRAHVGDGATRRFAATRRRRERVSVGTLLPVRFCSL
jgi:hypothetical protein